MGIPLSTAAGSALPRRRGLLSLHRAAVLFLTTAAACSGDSASSTPPATVAHKVEESALNTITLTAEAESRLGIETAVVEERDVPRVRNVGGEVYIPNERQIVVTAPVAGTVLAARTDGIPRTGVRIRRGDPIVKLLFLPTNQDLSRVREQVAIAEADAEVARRQAERADSLVAMQMITVREHELARAAAAAAAAALRNATARLAQLDASAPAGEGSDLVPMTLTAPSDGVLWKVWVVEGQTVASAAPLFEVIDLDPVWIRVGLYAGDVSEVDRTRPAGIRDLGAAQTEAGVIARPVSAPPSADPAAASVDLFYEVPNPRGALRPGQRLNVALPLRTGERGLVVPWSAILFDAQGGAWVYQQTAPHVFVRRRVELGWVSGGDAVIGRGVAAGASVVSQGAAELFGTEFGTGK